MKILRSIPAVRRRGTAYVFLLGVSLVVVGAGLAAVEASMASLAAHRLRLDADEARLLAQSGLEVAVHRIRSDAAWTKSLGEGGTILSNQPVGRGRVTVVASDPVDNDLANGDMDSVLLQSTATVGEAVRIVEARLDRRWTPLPVALTAVHAGAGVAFSNGSGITADRSVSSNAGAVASNASVKARVEVVTSASGSVYSGGIVRGVAAKTMPPADIVAQYTAMGTLITRASMSNSDVDKVLVSPSSNPWGASLNSQGIYVIDLANNDIQVKSSRIFGTLVFLKAKTVYIDEAVVWEPAQPGLPALLVEGDLVLEGTADILDEASVGRNLNPASTPYKGVSNTSTSDQFPSRLEGLIYVTGSVTINEPRPLLTGTLISAGQVIFNSAYGVTPDTRVDLYPPHGFRTGPAYVLARGTWRRVVP